MGTAKRQIRAAGGPRIVGDQVQHDHGDAVGRELFELVAEPVGVMLAVGVAVGGVGVPCAAITSKT